MMKLDGPVDDEQSGFPQLFDDKVTRRLLTSVSQGSLIDIDKYGDIWVKLHQVAISVDDLLVFFPDSHSATFERSLGRSELKSMKSKRKCPIPGDEELQILYGAYEDCIKTRCECLVDVPLVQEQLLDSFCRSDGLTSGVFPLPKYPWIMATPDIAPVIVEQKSVIFQCDILEGSDWVNSKIVAPGLPLKTPKAKALAASKRKVQCLMYIMQKCLKDLLPNPVALLYLVDPSGTIHFEEEVLYDPGIEVWLRLACCIYTNEVHKTLSYQNPSVASPGFGELKWKQPKKKFKIGSVVFDIKNNRPFPSCYGTINSIDGDNVYVKWNGKGSTSKNRPCNKANLCLVPILNIVPPESDGVMVGICGGDNPNMYGKIVKVVDCRPGDDCKVRVENSSGVSFRIHRQFLHVVEAECKETPKDEIRDAFMIRVPKGVEKAKWVKRALEKRLHCRYIYHIKTYMKKRKGATHEAKGITDTSIYETAHSDFGSNSDSGEDEEQSRLWAFLYDRKAQLEYLVSDKAFKFVSDSVRQTFMRNFRDMRRWFGNDAIDIFVSFFNFRYSGEMKKVYAVPSCVAATIAAMTPVDGQPTVEQIIRWRSHLNRCKVFESETQIILIPLNQMNLHWTLAVVGKLFESEDTFVLHVDSMNDIDLSCSTEAEACVKALVRALHGDMTTIKIQQSEKTPQQRDSHSCGPFVIFLMECLATEIQNNPMSELTPYWVEQALQRVIISSEHVKNLRNMMISMANGLGKDSNGFKEQTSMDILDSASSISMGSPLWK